MKGFLKKIKKSSPTVLLYLIASTLTAPVYLGLFLAVGMSTDAGMNSLSVYIPQDLIQLIASIFLPFIMLIIFGHFISIIIMFLLRKKVKFSIKLYLVLLALQSLPFGAMMFGLHANTSLSYRDERINEIKIERGEIVKGTDMYSLLARYLELNNIEDIKAMAKQDKLILSYDYIYLKNYFEDIDFYSDEEFLEIAKNVYNKDFSDTTHIRMNKYIDSYLEMINEFIYEDVSVEEVHNKISLFMKRKVKHHATDNRSSYDDIEYSIPLIITYENINILNRTQKEYDNSEHESIILKGNLGYSQSRIEIFVQNNASDYQYGKNKNLMDNTLYIDYCNMVDRLQNEDILTKEKVVDTIKSFSEKHNLDLENDNLNKLQIAFKH